MLTVRNQQAIARLPVDPPENDIAASGYRIREGNGLGARPQKLCQFLPQGLQLLAQPRKDAIGKGAFLLNVAIALDDGLPCVLVQRPCPP